jgi:hypothetical protein
MDMTSVIANGDHLLETQMYLSGGGNCVNPEWGPATEPNYYAQSYIGHVESKFQSGETTQDYKDRVRNGLILPVTRYDVSRSVAEGKPAEHLGNCHAADWPFVRKCSGDAMAVHSCTINSSLPPVDDVSAALLQRVYADAQSRGWAILVELAEAPETVKMFQKYVSRFKNRKEYIARRARRNAKRKWKYVPKRYSSKKAFYQYYERMFLDYWMEMRYGWRPLVYSSIDILNAISSMQQPQVVRVREHKRHEEKTAGVPNYSIVWSTATGSGYPSYETASHSRTHNQRAFFVGDIRKNTFGNVLDLNPLSTAWELVPYSFVVDWFFNTSDLARAHWPTSSYSDYTMGTSVKVEESFILHYGKLEDGEAESIGGVFSLREERYSRRPAHSVPWDLSYYPRVSLGKMTDLRKIFQNLTKI